MKQEEIYELQREDPRFPEFLRQIADPPQKLYYAGDLSLLSRRCISIVGSRKTTEYGRRIAETLAGTLAEAGLCVVSGMAMGIDSCAHRGALKVEGKTIAILGCGIDLDYPAANRGLRQQVQKAGLFLSEYPPGYPGSKYSFPRRNRLISGISEATVVVEAGLNSGSLITAGLAMDQGRWVYAVPGNINSIYSMGSNLLIRDGAMPLVVLDDILDDLHLPVGAHKKERLSLGTDEQQVLSVVEKGGEVTIDLIGNTLKKATGQVNGIVTILEMKGLVYTSLGQ
ncbi:MAG: DNA-processing protein DprA, partial [Anaerovoracaceae bacterium]